MHRGLPVHSDTLGMAGHSGRLLAGLTLPRSKSLAQYSDVHQIFWGAGKEL